MAKKKRPPQLKGRNSRVTFEVNDEDIAFFKEYVNQEREIPDYDSAESPPPPSIRGKAKGELKVQLDLHGKTVEEAKASVDRLFSDLLVRKNAVYLVCLVTGKGLHSGREGAVLPREIHHHVKSRYAPYIVWLEDSPDEVRLGGQPIRGHFHVRLKAN